MQPIRKPTWQQATALVSLSTCGAMTGFAFAHGSVEEMTSPTRMPVHLVAVTKPEQPAATADSALRSAIVDVAKKYLRLARNKAPAQMEALIWNTDSVDGADHGESCAAFASLTLELGSRSVGAQSWVTGGTSYPWPLEKWADVRVDPNPDSLDVVSVLQDAKSHGRWHPLGDGYQPQPGDWVLFDGHVEVVTGYSDGVLHTIGGDSLPNFSVNAHTYTGSLGANGVDGFVNNGELLSAVSKQPASTAGKSAESTQAHQSPDQAQIPGLQALAQDMTGSSSGQAHSAAAARPAASTSRASASSAGSTSSRATGTSTTTTSRVATVSSLGTASTVNMPGTLAGTGPAPAAASSTGGGRTEVSAATATIPGISAGTAPATSPGTKKHTSPAPYTKNKVPSSSQTPGTSAQQAFISQIAPGAMAAQSRYGVPAAVTIAQAIDESGWGQSALAARDHNLFGIKGTGPAGTDMMPTREFLNGSWVTQTSGFRVYNNIAESISDHAELLATGSSYQRAMADRNMPDAFANDLTGVYATDPDYGSSLIQIMQLYNLYRYDASGTHAAGSATHATTAPKTGAHSGGSQQRAGQGSASTSAGGSAMATSLGGIAAVAAPAEGDAGQGGSGASGAAAPVPGVTASAAPTSTAPTSTASGSRTRASAAPSSAAAARPRPAASGTGTSAGQGSAKAQSGGTRATASTAASASTTSGTATPAAASKSASASAGTRATAAARAGGSSPDGASSAASLGSTGSGGGSTPSGTVISGGSPGARSSSSAQSTATPVIPGVEDAYVTRHAPATAPAPRVARPARVAQRTTQASSTPYKAQIPHVVTTAFVSTAKAPLTRAQPLYEDVASSTGIGWELLAACDWMQCQASPRHSPVHGEKLGSKSGGTVYHTRSEALAQCASDLVELAMAVYWIDITRRRRLSVRELAQVFAAFRWGGLLKLHDISALEFPYSVAGLTTANLKMRWPDIREPNAPDKPGSRFRSPFGAVPAVLSLGYRALR